MSRKIVVDLAKLESAAQKIDQYAADYEKQYNQLFNEVDGMGEAWEGADNIAFVAQIKGLKDDFQQMTNFLNNYSEYLKLCAKTYRQTQNEVISNAKRLIN